MYAFSVKGILMREKLNLDKLNTSQRRIVELPADKDILSVAGPGSGKTRTVTFRLANLALKLEIPVERLQAVTFSRAATQEMRDRLNRMDPSLAGIGISTIHGLCRRIISETQNAVFEQGNFQCYIEGQKNKKRTPEKATELALERLLETDRMCFDKFKRRALKQPKIPTPLTPKVLAKKFLSPNERGNPAEILQSFFAFKKTQEHCREHIYQAKLPHFSQAYASYILRLPLEELKRICQGMFSHYCDILTEWRLLDFTDQVIYAHLGLLTCEKDTLCSLRSRWDVLAIDEFQDVDAVQFEVFRLLCGGATKLNAVGDPDQAIYGFRGGDAIFVSEFKTYFPEAEIVKLDTNYRSHAKIIDVAYSAVESITQPYRAKGKAYRGEGGSVGFKDVQEIFDFKENGDVGVLAWTNKALSEIAKRLLYKGIICAVHTRWRSYLNVSKEYYDSVYETVQAMQMFRGEEDFDRNVFLQAATRVKGIGKGVLKVPGETLEELKKDKKVSTYVNVLSSLKRFMGESLVQAILQQSEGDSGVLKRIPHENHAALIALDYSKPYAQVLEATEITLHTIHRAKGLEFETVFVDPSDFSKRFAYENEEESKRLLFVALSRAKSNLFLLGTGDQGNRITAPVVVAINSVLFAEEQRKGTSKQQSSKIRDPETVDWDILKQLMLKVERSYRYEHEKTQSEKEKQKLDIEWCDFLRWCLEVMPPEDTFLGKRAIISNEIETVKGLLKQSGIK